MLKHPKTRCGCVFCCNSPLVLRDEVELMGFSLDQHPPRGLSRVAGSGRVTDPPPAPNRPCVTLHCNVPHQRMAREANHQFPGQALAGVTL